VRQHTGPNAVITYQTFRLGSGEFTLEQFQLHSSYVCDM